MAETANQWLDEIKVSASTLKMVALLKSLRL